ncbi:MAG: YdeI/OmpD-associated family protein [Chitinophagales bacterium]|nr:YdeI/OmpD-associated family protein [Chitinophagales bacterium]
MSIAKKMRLKTGLLYLLKAPKSCEIYFDGLEQKNASAGKQVIGQAVLFAQNKSVLEEIVPKLAVRLEEDALLWIAYPKKSGGIKSDITRDNGWDVVFAAGYEPVTQVAIDDNWSALRFRKTELIGPKLRDVAMEDRNIEGVDFINRTVVLPADAKKALKQYAELYELFVSMSFSHKKEYVESIVSAKKPETRERRIQKMIEMLAQKQAERNKK